MKELIGAAVFGQSGGPTSVINSSAAGVFLTALASKSITAMYGAANGIKGILEEKLYDIGKEDPEELLYLKNTPSSALGSVRYKLASAEEDDTDYKRLLEVFKKYNIRYFFYNGGNDSMDTCNKVSKYMQKAGYECRVMGVPKTIDNDLYGTDHCPGYGSAAKYIATSIMEVYQDARVYDKGSIIVIEIMGRNAGWLTAASALAGIKGAGPDLIYLPELPFDKEQFINDARRIAKANNGNCMVAASEGIKYADGSYVADSGVRDKFGHAQLGGVAATLGNILKEAIPEYRVRTIELSLLQRCASHCGSKRDVEEAFNAGKTAVKMALKGMTDYCVGFERTEKDGKYNCRMKLIPLSEIANTEKKVPRAWINKKGNYVTDGFIKYALPLIQGDVKYPREDGLPRFAKLKKVSAKKK